MKRKDLARHTRTGETMEDLLSQIVVHCNRMRQIDPAECASLTYKQGDSADGQGMKKGGKSATGNAAPRYDSGKYQVCSLEHLAFAGVRPLFY